ncbi:MAG: hypothetical protein EXR81_06370 [Gammaproteobacteria bacterium]|nr:hypothetical protein [Gammaproteobacteria bacterium]
MLTPVWVLHLVAPCSIFADSDDQSDLDSTSMGGFAGNIFAGYQINSYLALEVGAGVLPSVETAVGDASESSNALHLYGAIKGMLPLKNQFGLFAKLGSDSMSILSENSDTTTSATGILLAVGGSYSLSQNMALTLAYNQILDFYNTKIITINVNVGYGTLGLTYLF